MTKGRAVAARLWHNDLALWSCRRSRENYAPARHSSGPTAPLRRGFFLGASSPQDVRDSEAYHYDRLRLHFTSRFARSLRRPYPAAPPALHCFRHSSRNELPLRAISPFRLYPLRNRRADRRPRTHPITPVPTLPLTRNAQPTALLPPLGLQRNNPGGLVNGLTLMILTI